MSAHKGVDAEIVEALAPPKPPKPSSQVKRSYIWKWHPDGKDGYLVDADTGEVCNPTPSVLYLLKEEVTSAGTTDRVSLSVPDPDEWRHPRAYL